MKDKKGRDWGNHSCCNRVRLKRKRIGGGWELRVKRDDDDVEQMKGCRGGKSSMIVAKCEMEREEKPNGLMGTRGPETRCFKSTREIKKEEREKWQPVLFKWSNHAENLWQAAAVSILDAKLLFQDPVCTAGCYGDVRCRCCDATRTTAVFHNGSLLTTLEGLRKQQWSQWKERKYYDILSASVDYIHIYSMLILMTVSIYWC